MLAITLTATLEPELIDRLRSEYHEMPGLSITVCQAARLFQVEISTCRDALEHLVRVGFLRRSGEHYVRPGQWHY